MTREAGAIFVLVHGGWHGGWCWREVAGRLRALGHEVHAPTLTGLGERVHLADAVDGPDTHVEDIVNVILWEELRDVVLVGHSYGGLIVTGVASLLPERIGHLIYLDAFVPEESRSPAAAMSSPERRAEIEAARLPDGRVAPSGFYRWSADPERIAWLRRMTTPQPAACFGRGVTLSGREREVARKSYILAGAHRPSHFEAFHARFAADPGWTAHELPCLHDVMIEMPDELSALLHDLATGPRPPRS